MQELGKAKEELSTEDNYIKESPGRLPVENLYETPNPRGTCHALQEAGFSFSRKIKKSNENHYLERAGDVLALFSDFFLKVECMEISLKKNPGTIGSRSSEIN